MASPMADYSSDAKDFLQDYDKRTERKARLAEHQSIIKEFGENYERAYQLLNTFQSNAYKAQSFFPRQGHIQLLQRRIFLWRWFLFSVLSKRQENTKI